MQINEDTLQAFMGLFRGRNDCWGSVEGKSNKEAVTESHYKTHLEGKKSLGIYPLLDDGTCHFAAIDLDEKDFDKAVAIRTKLVDQMVPAYIAESKGKGYHIYVFAVDAFITKDIRRVLQDTLDSLKIKAEVFPKQDKLDERTPYGNYINLPCFGATRQFWSTDLKLIPLETAIDQFKFTPEESVLRIIKELPAVKPPRPKKSPKMLIKRHPPCIEAILGGVSEGARDEAAFALARHYLDCQISPDEVEMLLNVWDERNHPPINDPIMLRTKVESAEKGYAFGCSSIIDNPMLVGFCVGEEECPWLKETKTEFRAYFEERPDIRPALDFADNTVYVTVPMDIDIPVKKKTKGSEEVIGVKKARRLVTITSDKEMFPTSEDTFMDRGLTLVGSIQVPTRRWSLASIQEFIKGNINSEIKEVYHMIKQEYELYMDFSLEITATYASLWVIGTYFFPVFTAFPYTYFGGVREAGKTKMLALTQQMAFNSISSGNISTASIFRIVEGSRATLLIDEAEKLGATDRGQEFKNILNASYKPGNPVYRTEKNSRDQFIVTAFDAYSPKMLANISGLEDVLESRVIPWNLMRTLSPEIANREIDSNDKKWQQLRDKLYILALTKWKQVKETYDNTASINGINARSWEIWKPIVALAELCDVSDGIIAYAKEQSIEKLYESTVEAADSVLLSALVSLVGEDGYYSVRDIKAQMAESYGETYKWLTNEWIGRAMKRQEFKKKRRMGGGVQYYLDGTTINLRAERMGFKLKKQLDLEV